MKRFDGIPSQGKIVSPAGGCCLLFVIVRRSTCRRSNPVICLTYLGPYRISSLSSSSWMLKGPDGGDMAVLVVMVLVLLVSGRGC